MELLPDAEKFNDVAIAEPVPNEVVGGVRIPEASYVREADVILVLLGDNIHDGSLNLDTGFGWLFHGEFQRSLKPSSLAALRSRVWVGEMERDLLRASMRQSEKSACAIASFISSTVKLRSDLGKALMKSSRVPFLPG